MQYRTDRRNTIAQTQHPPRRARPYPERERQDRGLSPGRAERPHHGIGRCLPSCRGSSMPSAFALR